jgi:hypothetical protein
MPSLVVRPATIRSHCQRDLETAYDRETLERVDEGLLRPALHDAREATTLDPDVLAGYELLEIHARAEALPSPSGCQPGGCHCRLTGRARRPPRARERVQY